MSCSYAECDRCAFRDDQPHVCDECVNADQFEPMTEREPEFLEPA